MNENELRAMSEKLHKRFGKKFHNAKEAYDLLFPIWQENPEIGSAILFGMAAFGAGKKKPHASEAGDSGDLLPISRSGARSHGRNTRVR